MRPFPLPVVPGIVALGIVVLGTALLALGLPGCGLLSAHKDSAGYTERDLRADLGGFVTDYTVTVGAAADEIARRSPDREERRRALLWRITMVPLVQEAAYRDDPQEAWAALLALVAAQRLYLVEGDGADIFGTFQAQAADTARDLQADLQDIGSNFLTPEQLDQAATQADEIARRHPIKGTRFSAAAREVFSTDKARENPLKWLINVPMAPFSALEGVGDTPQAIREINRTAREFAQIANMLPRQVRWQAELLAYDLEDRETTSRALEAAESVAASVDRAVAVAERVPVELEALLENRSASLEQARAAIDAATTLAAALQAPLEELHKTAETLRQLTASGPVESGVSAPANAEPARPFDVREWEQASRELGRTATELRGLAREINALIDPASLDRTIASLTEAVDHSEAGARELVDHAAWRAVQWALVAFVLAVIWKLVPSRRAARRET